MYSEEAFVIHTTASILRWIADEDCESLSVFTAELDLVHLRGYFGTSAIPTIRFIQHILDKLSNAELIDASEVVQCRASASTLSAMIPTMDKKSGAFASTASGLR